MVDVLENARLNKLESDRVDILRVAKSTNSQLTAISDRTVQYAALLMNSVLTGGTDFTPNSAELIIAQFEIERQAVEDQLAKLNAVAGLRVLDGNGGLDPAATYAAFTAFVQTYNLDLAEISKKYNAI